MSRKILQMNIKKEIKSTLAEIERLVTEMTNVSVMVGASFGIAYRKCGKATCRCNSDESKRHPVLRITFTENRKSKSRAIPKKDEQWVKEVTDNYRNFRQNFQQLRICENKLNDLLNQFEKSTKEKTKILRNYL
jgi:hypothetical protein